MGARLRVQNEQAEKLRLENQIVRAETLNRTELERVFTELADALVGFVKNEIPLGRLRVMAVTRTKDLPKFGIIH